MAAASTSITPYRVSTITANGHVGVPLNLERFFDGVRVLPVDDTASEGFVYVERKLNGTLLHRGVNPRAKRVKKGTAPGPAPTTSVQRTDGSTMQRFMNQITAVYRMGPNEQPNVKIFELGMLQMTGVKRIESGHELVNRIIRECRELEGVCSSPSALVNNDYMVRMINANFSVPYAIHRMALFNLLRPLGLQIVLEADTYQGLKLHYYINRSKRASNGICDCNATTDPTMLCEGKGLGLRPGDCKRVTFAIFNTGSMLISGATSIEQVDEVYKFIVSFLEKHGPAVAKPKTSKPRHAPPAAVPLNVLTAHVEGAHL